MSSKVEPQHTYKFLILKGIQAMKQEVTNELNSKEEEPLANETMLNKMLQLFEENAQLKNELLASKDEQIKLMKTIGELCCEKVQLKEQLAMTKETIKEQSTRINQLEEEKSQQQQEIDGLKLTTQQQLLDNATKQNEINDMKKQLHQANEELKEAQEKRAKAEEELIQKQLELDNCTKKVEQREEALDNRAKEVEQQKEELVKRTKKLEQRKEELDNRKKNLDTREQHLDEEKKKVVAKLNTCTKECSTKQKEYDAVVDALSRALVDYGKQAKYIIEKSNSYDTESPDLCTWQEMRKHLASGYNDIWMYLHKHLTNNVSKKKDLKGTILTNSPIFLSLGNKPTCYYMK